MADSNIEWTDKVWNPTTGCTKGCSYCYARTMAGRLQRMGQEKYRCAFTPTCHPLELEKPLTWKKPRRIFVNSMGDLFDPAIPFEFIDQIMAVIAMSGQHTFQILTKYSERMQEYFSQQHDWVEHLATVASKKFGYNSECMVAHSLAGYKNTLCKQVGWPMSNLWLGVTISCQEDFHRWWDLYYTTAAVRFISFEPLTGPIRFDCLHCHGGGQYDDFDKTTCPMCKGSGELLDRLDWVIVGGMTGKDARPLHPDWVRTLRDQCAAAAVPFFFKQWGEWRPRIAAWEPKPFGIFPDGSYYQAGLLMGRINAEAVAIAERHAGQQYETIHRVGKKAAGARIDGKEWKQFPESSE